MAQYLAMADGKRQQFIFKAKFQIVFILLLGSTTVIKHYTNSLNYN